MYYLIHILLLERRQGIYPQDKGGTHGRNLGHEQGQRSLDGTARIWQLDPIVLMPADQRENYVCRERLVGARSFTDREMQEPMLRWRDELRDPCNRVGPRSFSYYRTAAANAIATIRGALSN
jgi:hypothetical protein